MKPYTVRRSRISLFIGYLLAEGLLIAFLIGMFIIWRDEPTYLDWPLAIFSWVTVALYAHFLLFMGTFYKVEINGDSIAYHAFLRKTKHFHFSDIQKTKPSIGVDVKLVGQGNKKLFYVKQTDRNYAQFMEDVSTYANASF